MNERMSCVVIGGGLWTARCRSLKYAPVQVTLIDRRNFHLFNPSSIRLQRLSPADIASPLRAVLKRQRNVQVLLAEATDIDVTIGVSLTTER
jgi:NADH dehydrogenase